MADTTNNFLAFRNASATQFGRVISQERAKLGVESLAISSNL
jgi:hypothetical protein